ncbi:MAG: dUTP diphosphatase [Planctomycetota bacterium]|jgi:dUTP pyrophosphatase
MVPLRFKRLSPHAVLPQYQSEQASGMDLHAALEEPVMIEVGGIARIPCGFAVAVPDGHEAQIRPRSGLASNFGLSVPNAPGTVDSDYRGEVIVALINHGPAPFVVEPKMRIAQMVVAPVAHCEVEEVEDLDDTDRGAGGFGSTGT